MTKRKKLENIIAKNNETIKSIQEKNVEIQKQLYLLCDKKQWFTEKLEMITERVGKKKIKVEKLIGRIHWNEQFLDEDTAKPFFVERSKIVRIDENWI